MSTNLFVELSDDLAQNVGGGYYFGDPVNTNIRENLEIFKYLQSDVFVRGQFAGAEAGAVADGPDSATQAITNTITDYRFGSASQATSTSATNGFFFYVG